jgi:hypothetical protein
MEGAGRCIVAAERLPKEWPVARNRLTYGEKTAGISAILLFAFMFLDWYSFSYVQGGPFLSFLNVPVQHGNAWKVLDVIPLVLGAAIAITLLVGLLVLLGSRWGAKIPAGVIVAVLGAISFLLILYRIVDPPADEPVRGLEGHFEATPLLGIYLALAAAGGIALGGLLVYLEEGCVPRERGTAATRISRERGAWQLGLDKLSVGEKVAAISAILLLPFMFLDWFGVQFSEPGISVPDKNAWEVLDYIPILLLVAIVAALGVAALRLTRAKWVPAARAYAVVAILGVISSVLILLLTIAPPLPSNTFREVLGSATVEGTVHFPIFLAMAAAAGIAIGGCLAMWEELRQPRRPKREALSRTTPETDAT